MYRGRIGVYFQSKENAAGNAPLLTIQFVPEPATIMLLVMGGAVAFRRRRD